MVNEYGSVGGGGPSAGYSGAGGGSPGSSYTTNPLSAADAAAALVTGGNVVAGQVIAGSFGNDAAFQAAKAAEASRPSPEQAANPNPVGTKEWWSYEIAAREAAARSNIAGSPSSPSTPGYIEYAAFARNVVGSPQWWVAEISGRTAEARANTIEAANAQRASYIQQQIGDRAWIPGPEGTQMSILGRYGYYNDQGQFVSANYPQSQQTPPPTSYSPLTNWYNEPRLLYPGQKNPVAIETAIMAVPTVLYGMGTGYGKTVTGISTSLYDMAKVLPEPVKTYANVDIGFGTAIANIPTFVYSLPFATAWSMSNPSAVPGKSIEIGSGMVSELISRERESPGSLPGTLLGMYVGGRGVDVMGTKVKSATEYVSPIVLKNVEIPTDIGTKSNIYVALTKSIFSPTESGRVRAYLATPAKSEASMIVGSKSMELPSTGINLNVGRVATFESVPAAVEEFTRLSGREGTFFHATNEPSFVQEILSKKGITVGATKGEPLYFGTEGVVNEMFMRPRGEYQPGSVALLRITEAPKSVSEALRFGGTKSKPELPPGLYPGTKPLTGWTGTSTKTYGLQKEFIIPAGSKVSVVGVGYTELGGSRVPLIDISLRTPSLLERATVSVKQAEYKINAIQFPEMGIGKPIDFLKRSNIAMSNPLEEVAGLQWSPAQKAVLNPYLEEMARHPEASAGLKTIIAGQKAVPLFRDVTFVQREPVGEILAGRELTAETIGDVFRNRAAMGSDVVSGGSTTIRANLGRGFFDETIIGDIDAWAKSTKVAELQKREIAIISKDQPSVVTSREPGLQEGLPVAETRIAGSKKPLTEIHSIEAFPAVGRAENIGTLKAIGGAPVTGPTTGFFGGIRKSSASFDKMVLTQKPFGMPDINLNPKNVKHAVGTSAVAKEAASLYYGRDVELTKMKPSYTKGMTMERYAKAMDELLSKQKGEPAETIKKYQSSIEQNPLELPETRAAKARARAAEGGLPLGQILGVQVGITSKATKQLTYYYRQLTAPVPTTALISSVSAMGIVSNKKATRPTEYPYAEYGIRSQSGLVKTPYPEMPAQPRIKDTVGLYPSKYTRDDKTTYPTTFIRTPDYPATPTYPVIEQPPVTTPPTEYPPTRTPPTEYPPPLTPPTRTPPTRTPPTVSPPRQPPIKPPTIIVPPKDERLRRKPKKTIGSGFRFVEVYGIAARSPELEKLKIPKSYIKGTGIPSKKQGKRKTEVLEFAAKSPGMKVLKTTIKTKK